jgi:peptide/nickel transport system substrate-binding protein
MVPSFKKSLGDSVWFGELSGGTSAGIGFNTTRAPFDDVRLRKAVSLWIDRQTAIDILGDGYGRIKTMMVDTSWSAEDFLTWPGYNPETKEADRTEAKRLLAEAGYANGVTLRISGPRHKATQIEWWQGALAGSGINVELDLMETAEYDERRSGSNYTAMDTGASEDIPEALRATIGSKEVSPRAGPVHNDPKIGDFFDRLGQETTLDGRRRVYRELERYVMLDQVYLVQTFIGLDLIPFRDYVKGMYPPVYDPSDFTSYATVWLDK